MAKRSGRVLLDSDKQNLLDTIASCRAEAIRALAKSPINEPIYKSTQGLITSIDLLAKELTDDPEHFWLKPFTTPKR